MSSYKCWSPDLGIDEEEAKVLAGSWMDAEEAVDEYVENRYYDWESPEGPFDIMVCEVTPDGEKAGSVRTFTVRVEYQPSFYTSEKT